MTPAVIRLHQRTRIATEAMRERKARRLGELRVSIRREFEQTGREPPAWVSQDLNNARLVSIGLYEGRVQEFLGLYETCERDLECLYERASSSQPGEP